MTVWTGAIIVKSKTGENIIQLYISEKPIEKIMSLKLMNKGEIIKKKVMKKKNFKKSYFVTSLLRWVVWKCLI